MQQYIRLSEEDVTALIQAAHPDMEVGHGVMGVWLYSKGARVGPGLVMDEDIIIDRTWRAYGDFCRKLGSCRAPTQEEPMSELESHGQREHPTPPQFATGEEAQAWSKTDEAEAWEVAWRGLWRSPAWRSPRMWFYGESRADDELFRIRAKGDTGEGVPLFKEASC